MTISIPLIDVSALSLKECNHRASIDAKLHAALKDIGFAYLEGHGIGNDKIEKLRELSVEFFSLPDSVKKKIYT